jgi:hypothetical protein
MPQAGLSLRREEPPRDETRRNEELAVPGTGVPGRRTVSIQGRGTERYRGTPGDYHGVPERRRPARRPHERSGFKPDRAAMWAVLLGVLMILAAATSSHAAMLSRHHLALQRHPGASVHVVAAQARLRAGVHTPLRIAR